MARIPGYRLHKRSGQAVVTLNYKDHYLGPHGSPESRKLYRRLLAEYVASDPKLFGLPKDGLTVSEVMAGYLRHCKVHYGKNLKQVARVKLALKPVRSLYADCIASEFGVLQFRAIREKIVAQKNLITGETRSRNYINESMKRVVAMFRWAASEGLIPANVHESLRLIPALEAGRTKARETAPIKPVDQKVVDATLMLLPETVADMVRVQLLTGARSSEICGLRPKDIDRSKDIWTATIEHHKTKHRGKTRTLFIGPKCQAILAKYLLRGPDENLFRPCDSEKKRRAKQHEERITPMSCGNVPGSNVVKKPKLKPGMQYTKDSYRRCIARTCESNSIQHWHPHQLRHSAATKLRSEFDLETSCAVLGHSDAQITLRYAEQARGRAEKAAKLIG